MLESAVALLGTLHPAVAVTVILAGAVLLVLGTPLALVFVIMFVVLVFIVGALATTAFFVLLIGGRQALATMGVMVVEGGQWCRLRYNRWRRSRGTGW